MRIYDPRVARFLSIDPLTTKYPFYSPYQFAGNTPTNAIDLDGAEPYGDVMNPRRHTKVIHVDGNGDLILLDNRTWIFAQPYTINSGIMKGAQSYRFYWWRGDHWDPFRQGHALYDLSNGIGETASTATVAVGGGMLARGLLGAVGASSWGTNILLKVYQKAPAIATLLRFGAEIADESGVIGAQNAAYSKVVSYSASQIEKFITTEEGALFQVDKFKKIINQGGEALDKLLADPIYAVEHGGKQYILDGHNRLKAFSELEKNANVTMLSKEEATKMFKDKMDDITKGEFKTELKDDN